MSATEPYEEATFELLGGDVRVWIEQETIHMLARDSKYNDPIELTSKMAMQLSIALKEMAARLDD